MNGTTLPGVGQAQLRTNEKILCESATTNGGAYGATETIERQESNKIRENWESK